ncbi:MAG TPA: (d)CMP kinase [Gemmatimonadales bacterium]|nr:(d)CMP kinase [Gemmatimonadales bacterium]
MKRSRPVVAIDGPAGSGKSSTAKAVAAALGFTHLDSGAVYRAVALALMEAERQRHRGAEAQGNGSTEGSRAVMAAKQRGLAASAAAGGFRVTLDGRDVEPAIRSPEVTASVSRVAALPEVREYVTALLREAAAEGGVVMDGRDIGTVVFPDAEVKVFLVADQLERARRRLAERGEPTDEESARREAARLAERDARDSSREVAPLAAAPDAIHLDTTSLSFADQVQAVVSLVNRYLEAPEL